MVVKDIVVKSYKDSKEYELEIYVNIESMRCAEREIKKEYPKMNFISALQFMQTEIIIMTSIMGACCHLKGQFRPVGYEWFDKNYINIFEYIDELTIALNECTEDLLPKKN